MEILPFIEAIGFDFSVVGLLVAVTIGACWGLAARVNVSPLTAALTGVTLLGRRVRQGSVGEIAAIAFLVAVAGMVANAVADGIFDGEFPLPVIASRPAPVDGTSSTFDASCAEIPVPEAFLRADREEDLIKQDVIRSLCRRAETGSAAYQFLLRYTGEPEAKQLAQLAWAALLEANSAATNGQLRLEYVVVKVMRALALAFFLLFVAAFARLLHIVALTLRGNYAPAWPRVRRRLRGADAAQVDALQTARLESAASSRRTTAAQEAAFAQRAIALLMIVGCVTLTNGFINLWEGQADRYYKKLFNAYLVLKALDVDVASAPAPAASEIASYRDLHDIPHLVGFGEFRSSKVGPSEGYEFSGVALAGDRIFVADNETTRLQLSTDAPQSLFEIVPPAGGTPGISLRRPRALARSLQPPVDDIEAVAARGSTLFAVGSHALDSSGYVRAERFRIARMRRDPDASTLNVDVYDGLRQLLYDNVDAGLEGLLSRTTAVLKMDEGTVCPPATQVDTVHDLNIEGVDFDSLHPDRILLGLRSPLVRLQSGRSAAVVLTVGPLDAMFTGPGNERSTVAIKARLDPGGRGIAALEYDETRSRYFVAAAPLSEIDPDDYSSLWTWRSGRQPKELMRFPGHKLEGVAAVRWRGQRAVALAFDEETWVPGPIRQQFGRLAIVSDDAFKEDDGPTP